MGFKPKDRVRLKVRGVKIRSMVSLRKQRRCHSRKW